MAAAELSPGAEAVVEMVLARYAPQHHSRVRQEILGDMKWRAEMERLAGVRRQVVETECWLAKHEQQLQQQKEQRHWQHGDLAPDQSRPRCEDQPQPHRKDQPQPHRKDHDPAQRTGQGWGQHAVAEERPQSEHQPLLGHHQGALGCLVVF